MKDTERLSQILITLMEKIFSEDNFDLENEEQWSLNACKFVSLTISESSEQLAKISSILIWEILLFSNDFSIHF